MPDVMPVVVLVMVVRRPRKGCAGAEKHRADGQDDCQDGFIHESTSMCQGRWGASIAPPNAKCTIPGMFHAKCTISGLFDTMAVLPRIFHTVDDVSHVCHRWRDMYHDYDTRSREPRLRGGRKPNAAPPSL